MSNRRPPTTTRVGQNTSPYRYYLIERQELSAYGDYRGSTKEEIKSLIEDEKYGADDFSEEGGNMVLLYAVEVGVKLLPVIDWPDEKE
jgi:hypothetical protein